MTFDLDLWPTDLKINRDHLLIKNYPPTKFEASWAKRYWVISCTRSRMTFDLDVWPTDLNINKGHLLMKDYLPTKFEASGAKRSWVISCTRWSKLVCSLTLTFDLLTWKSIGIIYSPRTIYLPSLKLLGQSVLELSVAQGEVNWHDLWPWPLTYWPENQLGSSTHQELSTYQVWSFWGRAFLSYQLHKVKGYRHTDRPTDIPTYRPTDRQVQSDMPSFFKGGINIRIEVHFFCSHLRIEVLFFVCIEKWKDTGHV